MSPHVAVIGCGHWGKNLVRNFSELGALHSVCDPNAALADEMAERFSVRAAEFEAICSDIDIDGVVIAAPAPLHASLAMQAFAAGKHVYVEKPLAINAAEASRMIEAAADSKKHLMVGHLLQYHPAFVALKELVAAGELGAIRHIQSNRLSFGKLRSDEDVIWSFAPHDISMVLSLVGEEPSEVRCEANDITGNGLADKANLFLSFAQDITAQISVSWLHPFKEQKLVVIGERGMAVFDDTKTWSDKLTVYPQFADREAGDTALSKSDAKPIILPDAEPLKIECQYFLDLMSGTEPPRTDGAEGARVLKALTDAT